MARNSCSRTSPTKPCQFSKYFSAPSSQSTFNSLSIFCDFHLERLEIVESSRVSLELQVKGLSIEHEKLAVAQRHATGNNNSSMDVEDAGGSSNGAGANSDNGDTGIGNASGNVDGSVSGNAAGNADSAVVGEVSDVGEAGEATMVKNITKRTPTPAPSPAPAYTVRSPYPHYYESPRRLMR